MPASSPNIFARPDGGNARSTRPRRKQMSARALGQQTNSKADGVIPPRAEHTLAVNVAAALAQRGRDVLLVDGDEQASAATFAQIRAEQPANKFTTGGEKKLSPENFGTVAGNRALEVEGLPAATRGDSIGPVTSYIRRGRPRCTSRALPLESRPRTRLDHIGAGHSRTTLSRSGSRGRPARRCSTL